MANYNPKLMSMFGLSGSMFGMYLCEMAKNKDSIAIVTADQAYPAGLDKYKSSYPDRFFNVGIAEQNMIGVASGLADEGYKPICVAQACFLSMRCFEQIRQYAGYMRIPLILVGISSGYSISFFGNTHYAMEDIALMRTIPGMQVVAPCDAVEACKALEAAIHSDKPTYIRLFGGTGTPIVYNDDFCFALGKSILLREGKDLQIVATGSMVAVAQKVAVSLTEKNIEAEVIDMHTVKPIDRDALKLESNLIVTIEEHSTIGGLGDAVGSFLLDSEYKGKFLKVGIDDHFSVVGDYQYLLAENGLSADKIENLIINKKL